MDVHAGYNNVRIAAGHKWKAAFITRYRLFELTVMLFGLCNLPAMFQHIMDSLFIYQLVGGWLLIYMANMHLKRSPKLFKVCHWAC